MSHHDALMLAHSIGSLKVWLVVAIILHALFAD